MLNACNRGIVAKKAICKDGLPYFYKKLITLLPHYRFCTSKEHCKDFLLGKI